MVAKVISGQDVKGAIRYNEEKVAEGKAECILASGFLKDAGALNHFEKLNRFTDLNGRNLRSKTNTLHISLNFDVTEKFAVQELRDMATAYMDKIGFGAQPFLVYEHRDAAHPHVHIVTTIIRQDGKRIPIHYLGKNQSEKARKEIEIDFGLVKAESKSRDPMQVIRPVELSKVTYGKSETMRSIKDIVRVVTQSYKYTSLHELNAILNQFNFVADRGNEKSRMFAQKGLVFSLIDENGKRIGIPVKASAIYGKPTLAFLEKQFKLNEVLRQPHRSRMKDILEGTLKSPDILSKEHFIGALKKRNIHVVLRTNTEGRTYGVTFIDNSARVVFNGSALGKPYSAGPILERLAAKQARAPFRPGFTKTKKSSGPESMPREPGNESTDRYSLSRVFDDLTTAEGTGGLSPEAALQLFKRRKRKRSR